jgi:CheY-like chemotaxis protein
VEENVHLPSFLGAELKPFLHQARDKELELSWRLDRDVPEWIVTDAKRLSQILFNLTGNAVKFTEKGSVRVRVQALPVDADSRTALLRFDVADTGPGVSRSFQGDLFKPFRREQRKRNGEAGSGLGLSIVKRLCELLGGGVQVESEPGRGSTFSFTITATIPETPPEEAPGLPRGDETESPEADDSGSRPVVLLVEDDAVNRLTIGRMLEAMGYQHLQAANGRQALEVLEKEAVGLVLMDIQMPEMDGIAATRAIRRGEAGDAKTRVPIVALSAYTTHGGMDAMYDCGLDDVLAKPVDMKKLEKTLEFRLRTVSS